MSGVLTTDFLQQKRVKSTMKESLRNNPPRGVWLSGTKSPGSPIRPAFLQPTFFNRNE